MAIPHHIDPLPPSHLAHRIAVAVATAGGQAWMVGGSVRDALLARPSKDIDLEVHGLPADRLEAVLRTVGPVAAVGKSFGVFKVGPGYDAIDVALPRPTTHATEQPRGTMRGDPNLGLEAACRGRDLTLNAIVADPLTGELKDPTGGRQDLIAGRLRAADAKRFGDDPLRVIRVARFAATHGLEPDPALISLCQTIDLTQIAGERLAGEVIRALLRSERPSRFFQVLQATGARPTIWGEGPYPPHLDRNIDRAARLRSSVGPAPRDLALMLAVVLGEQSATAETVLKRLHIHRRDGFDVRATVEQALLHAPTLFDCPIAALDTTLRTIAEHVDVAVTVAVAHSLNPTFDHDHVHQTARSLGVLHSALAPLVFGRDLIAAGIPRGRAMGALLSEIRERQLDGTVSTPEAAVDLARVLWTQRSPTSE